MTGGSAVHGADVGRLVECAGRMREAADRFHAHRRTVSAMVDLAVWVGPAGARFRAEWSETLAPRLAAVAEGLRDAAELLEREATDQERTAAADGADRFDPPGDGKAVVLAAMGGLDDPERVAPDEIEVRALDNGRYIVVLPGVTDLSDGVGRFVDELRARGPLGIDDAVDVTRAAWADNDMPTVRKMRYAIEAARADDPFDDVYAAVVLERLEQIGVPMGAEVMLVGHSFGAYAAADLAARRECRLEEGSKPAYHVQVTHLVAAGAEVDWRLGSIPDRVAVLIANNRFDVVHRAEDLLHRDGSPSSPRHLEQAFWGGIDGWGHAVDNYEDWVAGVDPDSDVGRWLAEVQADYGSGGRRRSVEVPDPHRRSDAHRHEMT